MTVNVIRRFWILKFYNTIMLLLSLLLLSIGCEGTSRAIKAVFQPGDDQTINFSLNQHFINENYRAGASVITYNHKLSTRLLQSELQQKSSGKKSQTYPLEVARAAINDTPNNCAFCKRLKLRHKSSRSYSTILWWNKSKKKIYKKLFFYCRRLSERKK